MKPTLNQKYAFALIIICLVIIGGLCAMAYYYPTTPSFVMFAMGSISTLLTGCAAYLFGSTKGSQDKDMAATDTTNSLISQLAASAPVAAPVEPVQP